MGSLIVGNTPTSSSTAASNPKGPCEAVIVYFDKAVDTRSLLKSRRIVEILLCYFVYPLISFSLILFPLLPMDSVLLGKDDVTLSVTSTFPISREGFETLKKGVEHSVVCGIDEQTAY